jgi:hypothetical protein
LERYYFAKVSIASDASNVRESFISRPAALALADEDTQDANDSVVSPVVTLPAITFDSSIQDMVLLGKKMSQWLKQAIGMCSTMAWLCLLNNITL